MTGLLPKTDSIVKNPLLPLNPSSKIVNTLVTESATLTALHHAADEARVVGHLAPLAERLWLRGASGLVTSVARLGRAAQLDGKHGGQGPRAVRILQRGDEILAESVAEE